VEARIRDLLTPSRESDEMVQERQAELERRRASDKKWGTSLCQHALPSIFVCKEKRLAVNIWEVEGEAHGGAHYPLYVSTALESARSPASTAMRNMRKQEKRKQRQQAAAAVAEADQQEQPTQTQQQQRPLVAAPAPAPAAVAAGSADAYFPWGQQPMHIPHCPPERMAALQETLRKAEMQRQGNMQQHLPPPPRPTRDCPFGPTPDQQLQPLQQAGGRGWDERWHADNDDRRWRKSDCWDQRWHWNPQDGWKRGPRGHR